MKETLTILKWLIVILLFPISLLFIAYFNQKKSKKAYSGLDEIEAPPHDEL